MQTSPKDNYQALITAHTLSEDEGQRTVVTALDHLFHQLATPVKKPSFLRRFSKTQPQGPKGLYLYGGVGRGKSLLMDLFFDCLPEGMGRRVHFHDFMVLAHDTMNDMRQSGAKDPVKQTAAALAADLRVLCFDEMEVRDIADAMILKRLFDSLFAAGITVVATSNRHPDDLYKNGLHRDRFVPFITQLKSACDVLEIADGHDWRMRLMGQSPRWYVRDDAALTEHFEMLTSNGVAQSVCLKVAGRELAFETVSENVALIGFDALCAVPLAARDYVAIADRLTGLFLYAIPRLGDAEQNEARRFMWLIDAFYDRGRFIVASADCELEQLYHGRQWAFEFERTYSRLSEMTRLV